VLTDVVAVGANYVEVMDMRLVAGRTFTASHPNGVNEAMIDSALARRFFPGGLLPDAQAAVRRVDPPVPIADARSMDEIASWPCGWRSAPITGASCGSCCGRGATLVSLGVLIGAPGIYIAGGLIRGVLVGVSPSDPVTLVAVALGLLLVTMAACYVPARRATAIDPARLLRQG
jgi:hypothetical protein